jgi:hypothetical protein
MRSLFIRSPLCLALIGLTATPLLGCGTDEDKYEPKPAYTGESPGLPAVPNVPQNPIKAGDAYTVWGASYHLRSRVYRSTIAGKDIKLTGYIIKTNLADAPECAVHETGKEDPEDCKAPVPTFWVADSAGADVKDAIKVMGWASNFAQIYDAIEEYKKRDKKKSKSDEEEEPLMDGFWGVAIPNPLPVKGAKVTVKGEYKTTFTKATTGAEADPIMGVLTFDTLEYHETPEEKATLPGMKK